MKAAGSSKDKKILLHFMKLKMISEQKQIYSETRLCWPTLVAVKAAQPTLVATLRKQLGSMKIEPCVMCKCVVQNVGKQIRFITLPMNMAFNFIHQLPLQYSNVLFIAVGKGGRLSGQHLVLLITEDFAPTWSATPKLYNCSFRQHREVLNLRRKNS